MLSSLQCEMVICKHAQMGNFRISEIEPILSNANFLHVYLLHLKSTTVLYINPQRRYHPTATIILTYIDATRLESNQEEKE